MSIAVGWFPSGGFYLNQEGLDRFPNKKYFKTFLGLLSKNDLLTNDLLTYFCLHASTAIHTELCYHSRD